MAEERQRASSMTGREFRLLREHAQFTTEELAGLLDCHPRTIRNIESQGAEARVGRQLGRLLTLLVYPRCKGIVPAALEYREHVLRASQNITCH